jgi:hypothetical protein
MKVAVDCRVQTSTNEEGTPGAGHNVTVVTRRSGIPVRLSLSTPFHDLRAHRAFTFALPGCYASGSAATGGACAPTQSSPKETKDGGVGTPCRIDQDGVRQRKKFKKP